MGLYRTELAVVKVHQVAVAVVAAAVVVVVADYAGFQTLIFGLLVLLSGISLTCLYIGVRCIEKLLA